MNLIQDVLSAASAQTTEDHFCRVPLADILPDERNFYGIREIEELAASIAAYGLDQPLVVRPADQPGKYTLTGGHRRRAALLMLAEKAPEIWAEVDVKMTSSLGELADRARLIALNKTARNKTEYEQMREVVELAEIAKQWKAEGGTVDGKLREAVAQSVGISSAQAGKYQAINNHLIPSLMERYKAGQIGTQVAYELSGLPKRQQEEIAATNAAPTLEQARSAKAANKPAAPGRPAEIASKAEQHAPQRAVEPPEPNAKPMRPAADEIAPERADAQPEQANADVQKKPQPETQVFPKAEQPEYKEIPEPPYDDPAGDPLCICCPCCGSGEYLTNEDGNRNNYCGQCGKKILWPRKDAKK